MHTREKSRIKSENNRLAKKMIQANKSFTVKDWNKQYKKLEKIKKNISKPHTFTSKFIVSPISKRKALNLKKKLGSSLSP